MTQITINNINETQKQILASSSNNFQVELIINIGKEDYPSLIEISKYLVRKFGNQALLTEQNIPKYFNSRTLLCSDRWLWKSIWKLSFYAY